MCEISSPVTLCYRSQIILPLGSLMPQVLHSTQKVILGK